MHIYFFSDAMVKVGERLENPFNIDNVVQPVNYKISDAIMNFQESGVDISEKVRLFQFFKFFFKQTQLRLKFCIGCKTISEAITLYTIIIIYPFFLFISYTMHIYFFYLFHIQCSQRKHSK